MTIPWLFRHNNVDSGLQGSDVSSGDQLDWVKSYDDTEVPEGR